MRNDDHDVPVEYDDDERRLFAELPREAPVARGDVERLVQRLEDDGFFRPRASRRRWPLAAAAAALVFAAGMAAGEFLARRNSLEERLGRTDLGVADRILLLQRAGSAYVQAAQRYADATARVDSSAVEVASKVLMGAAHAVARNSLDAGLSARLATALQPPAGPSGGRQPIIWY